MSQLLCFLSVSSFSPPVGWEAPLPGRRAVLVAPSPVLPYSSQALTSEGQWDVCCDQCELLSQASADGFPTPAVLLSTGWFGRAHCRWRCHPSHVVGVYVQLDPEEAATVLPAPHGGYSAVPLSVLTDDKDVHPLMRVDTKVRRSSCMSGNAGQRANLRASSTAKHPMKMKSVCTPARAPDLRL